MQGTQVKTLPRYHGADHAQLPILVVAMFDSHRTMEAFCKQNFTSAAPSSADRCPTRICIWLIPPMRQVWWTALIAEAFPRLYYPTMHKLSFSPPCKGQAPKSWASALLRHRFSPCSYLSLLLLPIWASIEIAVDYSSTPTATYPNHFAPRSVQPADTSDTITVVP